MAGSHTVGAGTTLTNGTSITTADGPGFVLTNNGTIGGSGQEGVFGVAAGPTVINSGKIIASAQEANAQAVRLVDGGRVVNNAGGLISASNGLYIGGLAGTVVNSGTVTGASGFGVYLHNGGSVQNGTSSNATASLSGSYGVKVESGAGSVTNNASIAGSTGGVISDGDAGSPVVQFNSVADSGSQAGTGGLDQILFAQPINAAHFTLVNGDTIQVACFAAGTWIDTAEGPVAVEALSVGDRLLIREGTTVELARHAVIRTEGLPVESYLDTGDRANFGGRGPIRLFPDFARLDRGLGSVWETRGAARLVVAGPELEAAREAIVPPRRRRSGPGRKTRA